MHRGRRLVFVKMLDSGHLLLAGPKGLNRMPLMPVLQNFVIATSTSIPLTDAVKTQADKIDFSMFKKLQEKKSKESGIFTDSAAKVDIFSSFICCKQIRATIMFRFPHQ